MNQKEMRSRQSKEQIAFYKKVRWAISTGFLVPDKCLICCYKVGSNAIPSRWTDYNSIEWVCDDCKPGIKQHLIQLYWKMSGREFDPKGESYAQCWLNNVNNRIKAGKIKPGPCEFCKRDPETRGCTIKPVPASYGNSWDVLWACTACKRGILQKLVRKIQRLRERAYLTSQQESVNCTEPKQEEPCEQYSSQP